MIFQILGDILGVAFLILCIVTVCAGIGVVATAGVKIIGKILSE